MGFLSSHFKVVSMAPYSSSVVYEMISPVPDVKVAALAQLPKQPLGKLIELFDAAVCDLMKLHLVHWPRLLCDARVQLQWMKGAQNTTCPFWKRADGTWEKPLSFSQANKLRAQVAERTCGPPHEQ